MMNKTLNYGIKEGDPSYPHILEFGVYKGDSLLEINTSVSDKKIFGFDSFEGLPENWTNTTITKGTFNLNGIIPDRIQNIHNVTIFKGLFEETIPQYLIQSQDIMLLHIDCDLYSSTKTILYSDIQKNIKLGTIIVFDEWYYNYNDVEENRQHEQKAFYEWVNDFNISYIIYPEIEIERRIIKITSI